MGVSRRGPRPRRAAWTRQGPACPTAGGRCAGRTLHPQRLSPVATRGLGRDQGRRVPFEPRSLERREEGRRVGPREAPRLRSAGAASPPPRSLGHSSARPAFGPQGTLPLDLHRPCPPLGDLVDSQAHSTPDGCVAPRLLMLLCRVRVVATKCGSNVRTSVQEESRKWPRGQGVCYLTSTALCWSGVTVRVRGRLLMREGRGSNL